MPSGQMSTLVSVSGTGVWRTSSIGPQGLGAICSNGVSAWPATAQPRPYSMRRRISIVGTPRTRVKPTRSFHAR